MKNQQCSKKYSNNSVIKRRYDSLFDRERHMFTIPVLHYCKSPTTVVKKINLMNKHTRSAPPPLQHLPDNHEEKDNHGDVDR